MADEWNGKIHCEVIPHNQQRYPTVGDWWFEFGVLQIRVSDLGNPKKNWCVISHETQEAILCYFKGITTKQVDDFDMTLTEEEQAQEPGDMKESPYRQEHCFATAVERMNAAILDIPWLEYEGEMDKLFEGEYEPTDD